MVTLLFPGQGSQYVGMGSDFFSNFTEAAEVFEEVDSALSQNLSRLIFSGSEDELSDTENTQPAIMATSIAITRVIEKNFDFSVKKDIRFLVGHSLGEYSALCAAGSLSLSDTAKILRKRGNTMRKASPKNAGGMIALIADKDSNLSNLIADASKKGYCQVANDNTKEQIIISGEMGAINHIEEHAKDSGFKKAIKLNVTAPFHSILIKDACVHMEDALSKITITTSPVPIISNVTALPVTDHIEIKELLVKQIISVVRWRESIEYIINNGENTFIEIGPNSVLTKMLSRAYKDSGINFISIKNVSDLNQMMNVITSIHHKQKEVSDI